MRRPRPRCPTCARVMPRPPMEAFTDKLLRLLPEDAHARVIATLAVAQLVATPERPAALLLLALDCLARDLADQGHPVEVAST